MPATIKSRCLQFEFRRVPLRELTDRLRTIAAEEGLSIEPAALELIARQGTGSVRDSISLLDQIVTDPGETISLELAQNLLGTASSLQVRDLVDALADEDVGRGIHLINAAIDGGGDPRQFGQQIVNFLRNVMLAQTASAELIEASQEEQAIYEELAQRIERARLLKSIRAFNAAVNQYTGGWQPQLALELAFIEIVQEAQAAPAPAPTSDSGQTASRRPRPRSQLERAPDDAANAPRAAEDYERASASAPGEAPVYPVAKIQTGWIEILTQVHRYNRSIPPLLEHAHVRLIEGNRLILGVQTELFQQKIAEPKPAPKSLNKPYLTCIKSSFGLEVRVVDGVLAPGHSELAQSAAPEDPLIAAGKELGGVVEE